MTVAIFGTGGVRGYFGAKLALAGDDVRFIGRGEHGAAIAANGLFVESPLGDIHVENANVTDNPQKVGLVDYVIIAVKLWALDAAAEVCKPLLGKTGLPCPSRTASARARLSRLTSSLHMWALELPRYKP